MVTPVAATETFNPGQEWVDEERKLEPPAFRLLRRILLGIVEPKAPNTITVPSSPATLTTNSHGSYVVHGGTVSSIALVRSGTSVPTGMTQGVIPVLRGDQIVVTYTGLPTIVFFGS